MACSNNFLTKSTAAIVGLALVLSTCSASDNSADNLIDTEYMGRGRASSRYVVKQCKSCAPSECQVMGMQRYSEPRCEALGGLGAPCRPFQEPDNKTLHFPETIMYCNDVYMQFCPCAPGLTCDLDLAECKRPQQVERESSQLDSTPPEPAGGSSFQDDYDPIPIAFEPMQQQQQQGRPGSSREFPWAVARFH